MTNSWSLLAHHLEGTMDEVFPIKTKFKYNEDEILDSIKEYIGKHIPSITLIKYRL
ncbi:MAG: hypothetical protein CM15mV2_2610 [uncultured marine virus]|nr:MAG: hypothetical protein CM15mV2_2610 [uncultured marine virus]